MTEACSSKRTDLACGPGAFVIWWAPTAILVATAFSNSVISVVIWPVLLAFMGAACLINAGRCGRRHCYVTGPFFLGLAAVSLLYSTHVLNLGPQGWRTLAVVLLLGSCVLTCVPEWIWGRYVAAKHSQQAQEE